jgi:single-strand DNA-binding protein
MAASDQNIVNLIGRMVRDPEVRFTQGGRSVTNFSLANNEVYMSAGERKESVSFFNCVAWGKRGEAIAEYCKKGNRIAITGRLQQRSWEDQSGNKRSTVEIRVDNFQFLTEKKQDSNGTPQGGDVPTEHPTWDDAEPFNDDMIPF